MELFLLFLIVGVALARPAFVILLSDDEVEPGALTMTLERKQMLIAAERDQDFDLGFRGE